MDIDFDSELLWDIWYYFILYGSVIIFGLSLIRKFSFVSNLKKQLGKNYSTIPDLSKMKRWRKYLVILLLILSLLMLLYTMLRMESFLYLLPVLFVTGIVYLNGKLKGHFWDTSTTFFYSEKGFCIAPGKNKLYSFTRYNWKNVEKVKVVDSGYGSQLKVKFKDKKGYIIIRNKKQDSVHIKNVFKENGISIN